MPKARCIVSAAGGFTVTFHLRKCHLGWKTLLHQVGIADRFQNYFIVMPFLTCLCFSNSILASVSLGTVFFLSFTLQEFFPLAFCFLTFAVYFSTLCNVCLIFVVSFLPTFNLSVMSSMTIFLVNDSISQTSTNRMCNTW